MNHAISINSYKTLMAFGTFLGDESFILLLAEPLPLLVVQSSCCETGQSPRTTRETPVVAKKK